MADRTSAVAAGSALRWGGGGGEEPGVHMSCFLGQTMAEGLAGVSFPFISCEHKIRRRVQGSNKSAERTGLTGGILCPF